MANEQEPRLVGSDVFVSYKREDRDRVEPIVSALRALDLSVWLDAALEVGETFDEEISRELARARCHLVCWTKASVSSRWVRAEAHIGAGRNILVPIFLEPCTPFPPFNLDHTVSLEDWNGQVDHADWRRVLARVGGLLGRGSALSHWTRVATTRDAAELRTFILEFPGDVLAAKARHLAFQMQLSAVRASLLAEFGISEDEASANALPTAEVQLAQVSQTLNRERLKHADEVSRLKGRLLQAEDESSEVNASLARAHGKMLQSLRADQAQRERALTAEMKLQEEAAKRSALEAELAAATSKILKLKATVEQFQGELAAVRPSLSQSQPQSLERVSSPERHITRAKEFANLGRSTSSQSEVAAPIDQTPQPISRDTRAAALTIVVAFILAILYLGKDLFFRG